MRMLYRWVWDKRKSLKLNFKKKKTSWHGKKVSKTALMSPNNKMWGGGV